MRKTVIALIGAIVLVVSACGGGDTVSENLAERLIEESLESEGGGEVDIDFDDDGDGFNISVEGEDGESITIGGGEVPDSLGIDVPTGGNVMNTFESSGDVSVTLSWPMSEYDSLVSFYENWIAEQPTDFSKTTSTFQTDDGTIRNTAWFSNESNRSITIADCYSFTGDGLDSVCLTLTDSSN